MNIIERLKFRLEDLKEKEVKANQLHEDYLKSKEDDDRNRQIALEKQTMDFREKCNPILTDIVKVISISMEELALKENLGKDKSFVDSKVFKDFKANLNTKSREAGLYYAVMFGTGRKYEGDLGDFYIRISTDENKSQPSFSVNGEIDYKENIRLEDIYFGKEEMKNAYLFDVDKVAENLNRYLDIVYNCIDEIIIKRRDEAEKSMILDTANIKALKEKNTVEEDNDEIER